MDEHKCEGEPEEGKDESKVYKRPKPPDKRKHQVEMEHLTIMISAKEALYKSLNVPKHERASSSSTGNREELLSKLRSLKAEKEKRMKRKQAIDAELKELTQILQKKTETCAKLQATLRYKDEQRTNDTIKRLERHLSTHQLKLCEEKKLVSEIDALKRSKKNLSEYLCAKQEVDQLRSNQRKLRDERDSLIRETHGIKAEEKSVKDCLDELKPEMKQEESEEIGPVHDRESLKKEIDGLYEKRRELRAQYKQDQASYREEQKKMSKHLLRAKAEEKREEMRMSKISNDRQRPKSRQEISPYEEEVNVCVCLIQYLEPFRAQAELSEESPAGQAKHLQVSKSEFSSTEDSQEGSFVMKKDNAELDGLFAGSSRRIGRKGSRRGRKAKDSCQKLVLHPHVFEQFLRLHLEPPTTYADVSGILQQLIDKKEFYERSATAIATNPKLPVGAAGEGLGRNRDSDAERGACGATGGEDGYTGDDVQDDVGDPGGSPGESQEPQSEELSTDDTNTGSKGISQTSEISRTEEDDAEHQDEEDGNKRILVDSDQKMSGDEQSRANQEVVEGEKESSGVEKQIIDEKVIAENEENSKGNLKDACVKQSTAITDTLEKGLDRIGMKGSTKEIQVRAT